VCGGVPALQRERLHEVLLLAVHIYRQQVRLREREHSGIQGLLPAGVHWATPSHQEQEDRHAFPCSKRLVNMQK